MSPVDKICKSVKMAHLMHGFGHRRKGSGSSSSDSESEIGLLCDMPVVGVNNNLDMTEVQLTDHKSDHHELGTRARSIIFRSRTKSGGGWCLPKDIRHGYMAVYVGRERKRFVISTQFLSHRLFKALLKRSAEEFGFDYAGGLAIACEPVLFEHLIWLIGTNDPSARAATESELEDLLEFYEF